MNLNINKLYEKNGVAYQDVIPVNWFFENINELPVFDRKFLNVVNKRIKSCTNIYNPKYIVLYHATAYSLKDTILKQGLLPTTLNRRRSYQSTNGYVYLAHDIERAKLFGELGNSDNVVIFAVLLRMCDLSVDKDQLRNMRVTHPEYDIKDTLADSLIFGGGVRYKGKIENYKLINLN